MSTFVAVDQIDKVFNLTGGGQYIALKGIDLQIKKGEFVSLIGHSGCGKSTLLNMIAGLDLPTEGIVTLEGQKIIKPGPDRMVVFQNYSLLPWRTVRENIALAVDSVMKGLPAAERKAIIDKHINMVGLQPHADKQPGMLSGGQKQRVAINSRECYQVDKSSELRSPAGNVIRWTKAASCDRSCFSDSSQVTITR